jgi:NADH-quinone oxidoreductase subunit L
VGYVVAIPLLPAAAFALLAPLSRRLRNRAIWLAFAAVAGSLALAVAAFVRVWPGGHAGEPVYHASAAIAHVGDAVLTLGVRLEPTSALMLLVVTIVGVAVQWYSFGYMHREERIGWYYAVLSLFTAAMLGLVLADNFLVL